MRPRPHGTGDSENTGDGNFVQYTGRNSQFFWFLKWKNYYKNLLLPAWNVSPPGRICSIRSMSFPLPMATREEIFPSVFFLCAMFIPINKKLFSNFFFRRAAIPAILPPDFFRRFTRPNPYPNLRTRAVEGRLRAWKAVSDPCAGTMLTLFDALAEVLPSAGMIPNQETIADHY